MRGFGGLEAVIMNRLWGREGKTTVRDVVGDLRRERQIAETTAMPTMDNLHTKGWLAREREGKAYTYWPTLTREQYSARLMHEALDAGRNSGLVLTHLLEQMTDEESANLRKALARLARKAR